MATDLVLNAASLCSDDFSVFAVVCFSFSVLVDSLMDRHRYCAKALDANLSVNVVIVPDVDDDEDKIAKGT